MIRENAENESEDEEDAKFSTLSMIANLKVLFYKLDLGAQLGEKNQLNEKPKPLPPHSLDKDDDEAEFDILSFSALQKERSDYVI